MTTPPGRHGRDTPAAGIRPDDLPEQRYAGHVTHFPAHTESLASRMNRSRPLLALLTPLALTLPLVGCADAGGDTTVTTYVTETVTPGQDEAPEQPGGEVEPATAASPLSTAAEAFAGVLDDPGRYSFSSPATDYQFTGDYLYGLADITGDGVPELLLEAVTEHNLNPVRVFSAGTDGTLVSPEDVLIDGAAAAGGSRTALSTSPAGDRVYQEQWRSIAPEVEVEAFVLEGERLVPTGERWTYDQRSPSAELLRIDFHPVSDRGPLDALSTPGEAAPAEEASTGGDTVAGTVQVLTAPELADLQGLGRTPNGEDASHRYAVFVFDAPTTFSAQAAGASGAVQEQEASLVRLGSQTPYGSEGSGFDLAGQRLNLAFEPTDCWFPSDASLPLGEPNCADFSRE